MSGDHAAVAGAVASAGRYSFKCAMPSYATGDEDSDGHKSRGDGESGSGGAVGNDSGASDGAASAGDVDASLLVIVTMATTG